jgi:hypothetical protein
LVMVLANASSADFMTLCPRSEPPHVQRLQ